MIRFTAMPWSFAVKALIIGIAVLALGACSLVRVSYGNGPALASWWLDGYLDLDEAQEAAARPLLRDWFAWHRATQLPDYVRWLATWRERAGGEVNADEICRWTDLARDRLWTAVEAALPAGAKLLPGITPAQWTHLANKLADRLAEERDKLAPPSAEARRTRALERAVDRAESFYGPIDEAQRRLLADGLADAPMHVQRWLDDRERRQQRFVAALRAAQAEPDAMRRLAALRQATQALMQPADAETAALLARRQAQGCALTARLHASSTAAQRQHLKERLGAWEEDLRALAAAGAS